MTEPEELHADDVQQHLKEVQDLLARQKVVEGLVHRQDMPRHELVENLVHKQHEAGLRAKLDSLHPADIAYILEALPREERLYVWDLVKAERDGEILLEVSDAVRESLIETMDPEELKAAAGSLDADELADLAPDLPPEVIEDVFQSLDSEGREQLRAAMSYPEDSVGALMDFDMVTVRDDVTLEVVLRYLRRFDELPDHTDKLFVVDREDHLEGILTLETLLISDPEKTVAEVMRSEPVISFTPEDEADDAAQAFERYDLVSAPVIDSERRVIGRITVADAVDFIREESEAEILSQAGLREEEDIFASVWSSVKNRWAWLAINLVTAFVASRVIGLFEESIEKLVALAALMPIVAGIGGNSGNQTVTMIVRAIAMGQVEPSAMTRLLRKELGVALINGVVWGGLLGVLAWWLYGNVDLGLVMTGAMTLNLLLAACAGVLVPMLRQRLGADPALGGSVMITALTDSGGFFIFLGLATLFLL
ncbi:MULTISPECIES: magnesium transporter [Thauera]|jgi:magnesium transporter|uniref:Magnesium transporter MgtE n=2 Tax=Thauera aminoaromatica TaxID=164330 RepID=C4KC84_THASP|nr:MULTISPECIES: magnesium transporter [Thauera]ACR02275.1 magnesium transporter [Thauera aminoaromatica]ENO83658.1 magnesium transporter [Thauera aminoaromatica S2]KIN89353.1 magnesium transporter [Thauera sp. SWB20]MBL8461460.1 magnesium transporter [Thauera sp.]MBP6131983.1 magnesium transporter [Thauera sp.]